MANKIETNSKNFKPRINLNHNKYKKNTAGGDFLVHVCGQEKRLICSKKLQLSLTLVVLLKSSPELIRPSSAMFKHGT